MLQQIKYQYQQAWASLRLKPAFMFSIITTIGITFGVLISVLSLAYMMLASPLPYPQQERLYRVNHDFYDENNQLATSAFTYPGLVHLYRKQQVFDQAALLYYIRDVITSHPDQAGVNSTYVSPQWFGMLDIPLHLGRGFGAGEAVDSFNPVAVISYQSWLQTFNGAPDILEQSIDIRGVSYRIIGVTAGHFIEPELYQTGRVTDIWLPWDYNWTGQMRWGGWEKTEESTVFIGRLKPEYTPGQAARALGTEIDSVWQENTAASAHYRDWHLEASLDSLKSVILADSKGTLFYLVAGVIALGIIALVNIANLFMSHTLEQARTLAIHAALGARKKQLFYRIFGQTSLLMLFSMILALYIAKLGFTLMQHQLDGLLPRVDELGFNAFTLILTLALLFFLAWLFAAVSTSTINFRQLNLALQHSGKNTGVQIPRARRKMLIGTQVMVATVLVFLNIALFQQALSVLTQNPGMDIDNSWQLRLTHTSEATTSREEKLSVLTEIQNRLAELPQVSQVSRSLAPLIWFGLMPTRTYDAEYLTQAKFVDQDYFRLLGQPLLEGDYFSANDVRDRNRVMIVNDVFARQLNPNGSVLGRQVGIFGDQQYTITGVVKGILLPGESHIPPRRYTPDSGARMNLMIKLKPRQQLTRTQIIDLLATVDSRYHIFSLRALPAIKDQQVFRERATLLASAALTLITLFLAGLGLYGILNYSCQVRRFEIGTRLALGAKRHDILALIIRDNAAAIVTGVGLALALLLALYLGFAQNYEHYLGRQQPLVLTLTLSLISLLSLAACYWPLRPLINRPAALALRGT
ncbi:ABC transporter permease [Thalassomonas viridans]|uniref:ABC transporter permease n=1 Tax=Thalassomonas viridans TaxID=137584 RepID=A0AAF0C7J3_9GAMM|nr:ABC transporter permease [Thalassomonas viridans]WDE03763.1 ABC transporter permease [Thalassomonas viridans]